MVGLLVIPRHTRVHDRRLLGLLGCVCGAGVDHHLRMLYNSADGASLLEVADGSASERAADLHAVRDDGGGDDLVRRHLLVKFLERLLVKQNLVGELVAALALGPLLRSTRAAGRCQRYCRDQNKAMQDNELHQQVKSELIRGRQVCTGTRK